MMFMKRNQFETVIILQTPNCKKSLKFLGFDKFKNNHWEIKKKNFLIYLWKIRIIDNYNFWRVAFIFSLYILLLTNIWKFIFLPSIIIFLFLFHYSLFLSSLVFFLIKPRTSLFEAHCIHTCCNMRHMLKSLWSNQKWISKL